MLSESGRCSLRNRQFLKRILPMCADQPMLNTDLTVKPLNTTLHTQHASPPPPPACRAKQVTTPAKELTALPTPPTFPTVPLTPSTKDACDNAAPRQLIFSNQHGSVPPARDNGTPSSVPHLDPQAVLAEAGTPTTGSPSYDRPAAVVEVNDSGLRRGTRVRQPKRDLSPVMTGKCHDYTEH